VKESPTEEQRTQNLTRRETGLMWKERLQEAERQRLATETMAMASSQECMGEP
jgi:hypothetical protein